MHNREQARRITYDNITNNFVEHMYTHLFRLFFPEVQVWVIVYF